MNKGTPDLFDWGQRLNDKRTGTWWWEFSSDERRGTVACGGVAVIVALNEGTGGEETDVTVVAGERIFNSFFWNENVLLKNKTD